MELTEAGDAAFHRLRAAAVTFDRRLRGGMSQEELDQLRGFLARLRDNVAGEQVESVPALDGAEPSSDSSQQPRRTHDGPG